MRDLVPVLLSGVVAALVVFFQNRWLENRRAQEIERNRLRECFAEAFAVYTSYKEFPYAIRRRRADQLADERTRLSEELRQLQGKLSYFRAWTQFESSVVGEAYAELILEVRAHAGAAIRAAWQAPPSSADTDMNISLDVIDLRALAHFEDRYIAAVDQRLAALTPRRLRRK